MTELEKLRKHMKYFRAFVRNTKTIVSSGANNKTKVGAIRGDINTFENQWPNWLDDNIEAMPDEVSEAPSLYPECDKMLAVKDKSQAIGEFLEWLQSGEADVNKFRRPIFLAAYRVESVKWDNELQEYVPIPEEEQEVSNTLDVFHMNTEQLLARFFGIDLKKVEEEKRAMLERAREVPDAT